MPPIRSKSSGSASNTPAKKHPTVLVARGSLPPPAEASAERNGPMISLQWTMRENAGAKRGEDHLLAVAYDAKNEQAYCRVPADVYRKDGQYSFTLDETPGGLPLHVYLAFADSGENDACDSMYLGEI